MKKTFATLTLAFVTVFGATFANAGIIVGDAPSAEGIIVGDKTGAVCTAVDGIIVGDAPSAMGIIVGDAPMAILGIIVGDFADTCGDTADTTTGIIVGD